MFRLGRLMDKRGPGLVILLVPTIDRMVRVSLRTVTLTVPPQEIITRDNIPARVTAVTYYRVVDPNDAVTQVENFHNATLQIAQTTLRSVLGGADLDTLLAERERLNEALQHVIDAQTEPWGIKVTSVEIKDVEIPERMQHAIARQAEAERERRAKIINAEGEFQAAAKLAQAADVISRNPVTIQLRYLQTLREIGANQNSTVVFPMPIDLIKPMLDVMQKPAGEATTEVPPPHRPRTAMSSAPRSCHASSIPASRRRRSYRRPARRGRRRRSAPGRKRRRAVYRGRPHGCPRGHPQHRDHRPRRPRQDDARRRAAVAVGRVPRQPGRRRPRARLDWTSSARRGSRSSPRTPPCATAASS